MSTRDRSSDRRRSPSDDRRRTPRRASRARDQRRARSLARFSRHRRARSRRSNAVDGDAARGFIARAAPAMTEVTTRGTPGLRSVRDLPIVQVRRSMRDFCARRGRRAVVDARGRAGRARARTVKRARGWEEAGTRARRETRARRATDEGGRRALRHRMDRRREDTPRFDTDGEFRAPDRRARRCSRCTPECLRTGFIKSASEIARGERLRRRRS